jgi:hypothetical protein
MLAGSQDKLKELAEKALEEHRAGLTEPLDPSRPWNADYAAIPPVLCRFAG